MLGVAGPEDDALEAALGLGELADLTVNNDVDPLNYDVSMCLWFMTLKLISWSSGSLLLCYLVPWKLLLLLNMNVFWYLLVLNITHILIVMVHTD